ncbi:septum formation family protein [Catellatospora sp. NPDC049609]|uniref:septum formation family protein n=1 Tax=Catellatospora sp. NPDC049609 TaxID=3155505 RepID=UPI003442952F
MSDSPPPGPSPASPHSGDICPCCGHHRLSALAQAAHLGTEDTTLTRRQRIWLTVAACFILVAIIGGVVETAIKDDDTGYPGEPILTGHLQVGDCLVQVEAGDGVTTLPEVPCDSPHESEVIGTFRPTGPYPGDLVQPEGFSDRCAEFLWAYAPTATGLMTSFVLPNEEQWNDPDHLVVCMATDLRMRTGSIRAGTTPPPSPGVAA